MKTIRLLALVLCLIFTSCVGREYVMGRSDMHVAPSLDNDVPVLTVVVSELDPVLDLAEGGDGRFAWTVVKFKKIVTTEEVKAEAPDKEKECLKDCEKKCKEGESAAGAKPEEKKEPKVTITWEEQRLLGVSLGSKMGNGRKALLTVIPGPLSTFEGDLYGYLDHGGTRICNSAGQCRKLKSLSKKIKPEDYADFLTMMKSGAVNVKEIAKGSSEYDKLVKIYTDQRIKDVKLVRNYVHKKYGSNLTDDDLERIAAEDQLVHSLVDWLGRDWKVFLTIPFGGIDSTFIVAGLVKVFTLPSIWGDKIDKPGYAEYIPRAEDTADMILRGIKDYSKPVVQPATVSSAKIPLPADIKDAIKNTPCASATTYEDYNLCAVKQAATAK